MKTKIYCATSNDLKKYEEKGYKQLPKNITHDEIILYKEIKVDKDSQLVANLIKVYEDPKWQKYAFKDKPFEEWIETDLGLYFAGIGFNWERVSVGDGIKKTIKLIINDETIDTLTNWRLEILFSDPDKICRLCPSDFSFPNPLYPVAWIYPYVKEEIKSLGKLVKVKSIEE